MQSWDSGYKCESAQDEESETIGSKRLGNPLPACVELSVRLDSCAMLVIVNQDSDDHDFVEVHECESAQEEKSETIGSRQLCAPLPSMRVPPLHCWKNFCSKLHARMLLRPVSLIRQTTWIQIKSAVLVKKKK